MYREVITLVLVGRFGWLGRMMQHGTCSRVGTIGEKDFVNPFLHDGLPDGLGGAEETPAVHVTKLLYSYWTQVMKE